MTKTFQSGTTYLDKEKNSNSNHQEREGVCKKFWTEIEGVEYLFKANITGFNSQPTFINFGEVFYSYLGKKVGLDCVNSSFAVSNFEGKEMNGCLVESFCKNDVVEVLGIDGLFSKYFKDDNTIFISADQLFCLFEQMKSDIQISPDIYVKVMKLCLADFFTMQVDRSIYNIKLLVKVNESGDLYLDLAPIFDNGHCFCLYEFPDVMKTKLEMVKEDFANGVEKNFIDRLAPILTVREEDYDNKPFLLQNLINDLALAFTKNEELYNLFDNFSKLDIRKELETFKALTKQSIPAEYEEFIIIAFEHRKNQLENALQETIKNNYTL